MNEMFNERGRLRSSRYLGTFPRLHTDRWSMVGQDGGQSVNLGERMLFVFSDTLLAARSKAPSQQRVPMSDPAKLDDHAVLLANSAGLATGSDLRQALASLRYYEDDEGYPREFLRATQAEIEQSIRFWPAHGILIDGVVYLFYLGIQQMDQHSLWAFRNIGVGLAMLDPKTGVCERLYPNGDWCYWKPRADDMHLGVQILREGDVLYVFGSRREGFSTRALLMRVHASQVANPAAYEFLRSTEPAWGSELELACDLGECNNDYSVSYNAFFGQYSMVYLDSYKKTLMLRLAERPWGPYFPPLKLIGVPCQPSSELAYLGFEHPEFRQNNGATIFVSYCQPHFRANSLVKLQFQ
jgi:hypothetical protein